MHLLMDAAYTLPDGFPFTAMIKNITSVLANESQGNFTVQFTLLLDSARTVKGFLDQGQLHNETCALIS